MTKSEARRALIGLYSCAILLAPFRHSSFGFLSSFSTSNSATIVWNVPRRGYIPQPGVGRLGDLPRVCFRSQPSATVFSPCRALSLIASTVCAPATPEGTLCHPFGPCPVVLIFRWNVRSVAIRLLPSVQCKSSLDLIGEFLRLCFQGQFVRCFGRFNRHIKSASGCVRRR